jgi:KaiC/GvpD/RAD55 family RecA-like ATPase
MPRERIRTYVEGLDEIMRGGIPEGHVVLVSGLPGTMKSSLTYSILHYNTLRDGRGGVYISLEQTRRSLESQMEGMGFLDPGDKTRVSVADLAVLRKQFGRGRTPVWRDFLSRVVDTRRKIRPFSLLVLDSLEALEILGGFDKPRADLFDLFEWLRDLGATSFVLTEAPPESVLVPGETDHRNDAGYLADGIIHLKMHQVSDVSIQRRLRIVKMRETAHETNYAALVLEPGKFSVAPALSV